MVAVDLAHPDTVPDSATVKEITAQVKKYVSGGGADASYLSVGPRALLAISPDQQRSATAGSRPKSPAHSSPPPPLDSPEDAGETLDVQRAMDYQCPPSVQRLATRVWWTMRQEKANQAILISGASKSGRTTTLHTLLEHFFCLSDHQPTANKRLHQEIVKSHLLLEYFGSCCTRANASATRFGIYTELHFDTHGALMGSKLADYNLDSGRVVSQPEGSCNFHIFYSMCAAAATDDLKPFKLTSDLTKFALLRHDVKQPHAPGRVLPLRVLLRAFRALGFKKRTLANIFGVLAGLLHLGNTEFVQDDRKKEDAATIKNPQDLDAASHCLGVSPIDLLMAMTTKTVASGDTVFTDFLEPQAAMAARDELITTIYENLFSFLVEKINERLSKESAADSTIGIFETEGIQNEPVNSVHEFCTNYFEERLRAMFVRSINNDVRALRQDAAQQVKYDEPSLMCADLMDKLLHTLSAEAQRHPLPSNVAVLEKLHSTHVENKCYVVPSNDSAAGFGVQHCTGQVVYSIQGFLTKNKTKYTNELIKLFRQSCDNTLLSALFSDTRVQAITHPKRRKTVVGARNAGIARRMTLKSKPGQGAQSPMLAPAASVAELPLSELANTYVMEHKRAIDTLTGSWDHCSLWSVACVSASAFSDQAAGLNGKQLEGQFDGLLVPALLSYNRGFPLMAQCPITELASRYQYLLLQQTDGSSGQPDSNVTTAVTLATEQHQQRAEQLLALLSARQGVLVGKEAVYFMEKAWLELEAQRPLSVGPPSSHRVTFKRLAARLDRPERDGDASSVMTSDIEMGDTGEASGRATDASAMSLAAPEGDVGAATAAAAAAKEKEEQDKKSKKKDRPKLTKVRRRWMCYVWFTTWWIPDRVLGWAGMHRPDISMAWREKFALCTVIALLSFTMLFFITGFSSLMCPTLNMYSAAEVAKMNVWKQTFRMIINGDIYDMTNFDHPAAANFDIQNGYYALGGQDVSGFFPRYDLHNNAYPAACNPTTVFDRSNMDPTQCLPTGVVNVTGYCHDYTSLWSRVYFRQLSTVWKVGPVAWLASDIALRSVPAGGWIMVNNKVYDVTNLLGANSPLQASDIAIFKANLGRDVTQYLEYFQPRLACLDAIAYVGMLDTRNTIQCQISSYILLVFTYGMVAVMGIKFLAALQLGSKRLPENINKFVILQVPCYTEGTDSLKKTIDSLALTSYDDTRKLLFVIADGMVRGSGNEKPTPDLVLDIFGVDKEAANAGAFSYHAIGEGSKQHNKGQVYSGLYRINARAIPFVVVVKCGTEKETSRAGNRGKRDSQMVLMKFLNKVFYNSPMLPLELELYHHIKNVIGVEPSLYEYTLMVDADTEVAPDCLTRLISWCLNDIKIMGLCGETRISNEKQSWITMIQVYEYYISHHLAKAFESLFGSVTCLPGCFCMYRIFSNRDGKRSPLLISPDIIAEYSDHNVDTLHKKNLLSLGEDRYLTTLMLKTFSDYRMKFMPDSHCLTVVPEKFSILLSQRRRWINSTIHNLFELLAVDDLCGCLIFSMRGVVFLDLFATLVMPASVAYLGYLIYLVALDSKTHVQALILVGVTYGLQAIIFLIKRQWQHVGWMIIHILSMPVFYLYIPLYSFWHFDDFSWGNTRVIAGEKAGGGHDGDQDHFDLSSLPAMSWDAYQMERKIKTSSIARPYEVTKSTSFQQGFQNVDMAGPTGSALSRSSSRHVLGNGIPRLPLSQSTHMLNERSDALLPGYAAYNSSTNLLRQSHSLQSINSLAGGPTPGAAAAAVVPVMASGPPTAAPLSRSPSSRLAATHNLPSDEALMHKIREIIQARDLNTLTKRGIRHELSAFYGVDLSLKRDYINACIETLLQG
ncbi:hypothetical protein RI367_003720 [Sorochytrium milnesiophthora]